MRVMEGSLISCPEQSREQNASARREQLVRIRGADPGQIGGDLRSRRCIVTNGNRMPGYRDEQEAARMDLDQKVQNGRGELYVCSASGHSLMSLVSLFLLAMALLLPQCAASDPCSEYVKVEDEWRDVSKTPEGSTDHCDEKRFSPDKWYSFSLHEQPATIPTQCIKNNYCGSKIAMRVDLAGQSLPAAVGENITAALCGSFDVLGKYDCCVLRSQVNIVRCENDILVYNFPSPFDRCPVALCVEGKDIEVPPGAIARMGDDVSADGVLNVTETTLAEIESTASEVITTARNDADSSLSLDEISATHSPPQPLMQQTTDSDTTSSVSEDHIYITESLLERISSVAPTNTSDIAETTSESQTTADALETDNVDKNEREDEGPIFTDLDSEGPIVELLTDTSSLSTMTSPLVTPTETDTIDKSTFPIISQEVTSETPVDTSSEDSSLSSTSVSSDDLSSPTDHHSGDFTSTTTTFQSDLRSTFGILYDRLSTPSTLSSVVDTSDSSKVDNDTIANTTKISELSEAHSAGSTMDETTETKTTEIRATEIIPTLDSDQPSTTETPKHSLATTTSQARTTKKIIGSLTSREPPSTRPGSPDVTQHPQKGIRDVQLIEYVRLVFKGEPASVAPVGTVFHLLNDFLKKVSHDLKTEDDFDWTYKLTNISDAVNFQNRTTYMDFEVNQTANDIKKISDIFNRFQLRKFIAENSNMTLIAECRVTKNCQYDSFEGAPRASMFQENAPAFITVIILCSICLVLLVVFLLYAHLSKRGSWKASDAEAKLENRRQYNGNQSPFTDAQIMKDEMVDDASVNDSAKDGDTNLNKNTWVIPLEQDPNSQKVQVAIATQDTKF